jgi:acetoin utilization protein AcuB
MLIKNIPFGAIPSLQVHDSVFYALQLMQDNGLSQMAVANGEIFTGIISEKILLDADEDLQLKNLEYIFLHVSVKENDHFLSAVYVAATNNLSIVPVINTDNHLTGVIDAQHLLKHISDFMHLGEAGGLIVLETEPHRYSFSEISTIVEANDAQVTQLNTTTDYERGVMQITIRLNKTEISDIIASFQRYEYKIKYHWGEELYTNELKSNYENLMNYLNV